MIVFAWANVLNSC